MNAKVSSSLSLFEKVLRGFETGGFTYTDVLAQLQRLLASGESPAELREILRRRESVEPLPEYVHVGILSVLTDALAHSNAQQDSTASIDRSAETQAQKLSSAELQETAATARAGELAAELMAARNALAAERDKTQELIEEIRAHNEAELRALRKSFEQSLAESTAAHAAKTAQLNAANDAMRARGEAAARESLVGQGELRELRNVLTAREAELTVLHQQRAKMESILDTRLRAVAELEAELRASRARAEQVSLELKAAQAVAADLSARLKRGEQDLLATGTELETSHAELETSRAELETSRAELETSRAELETSRAELAKIRIQLDAANSQAGGFLELLRTREWRRELDQRPSANPSVPKVVGSADTKARRLSPMGRMLAWCAVLLAALVAWLFSQHPSQPRQPAASAPTTVAAAGSEIRDCPTCPAMTVMPAGRFKQGSNADGAAATFEKPLHWVVIRYPFAVSTNAVTVDEFNEFISATARDEAGCDSFDGAWKHQAGASWTNPGFAQNGMHPVTCASWNDAQAYAQWLSVKTGQRYRLPSASEWEFAARAGGEAVQPWGSDGSGACENANVADLSAEHQYPGWKVFGCNDGYVFTAPVGSFKANAFGLHDMLGNVLQWTEDCWHADYSGAPVDGAARVDGDCSEHEVRGGSWFSAPEYVRANYRDHFAASYRTSSVGIRLVRDIRHEGSDVSR
jgi:formylglycine-generating enzyme